MALFITEFYNVEVEKVKEEARKRNKNELFVNAWVASKGFYSRLGFTEVGSAYESGEGAKKIYCQRMVLALTNSIKV